MDFSLRNLVVFVIALALFGIIMSASAMILFPGQVPVAPPKNSAEWGGLQIWSTPGNAYVEVVPLSGGMSYGGWTDENGAAQFSVEPFRTYRVTVTKYGFGPYSQTIYVDSTNWAVVTANL